MEGFASLRQEQKEAIFLLQAGTLLEYFDFMLYVHMAVLLNELFFPRTDPHTASLLMAVAFCSTYVARPFGALLFGFIGDNFGRRTTVILTTLIMALSCLVMANLPTYEQIGIGAAWAVTICRIIQGMSSMGERIGAEIYLMEITKPPVCYPVVSLISVTSEIGTMIALMIASFVTLFWFDWRWAFWIGTGIALIGTTARIRLRETPDFVDAKTRIRLEVEREEGKGYSKTAALLRRGEFLKKEKVPYKTLAAYFAIQCLWPVAFYLAYIYFGNVLKQSYGFTAEQVIYQNLIVSAVSVLSSVFLAGLSYKVFPLKILRAQLFLFSAFVLLCPLMLKVMTSPYMILGIQCMILAFVPTDMPANAIFYNAFPIFKRFTYASLTCSLSRALMALLTSFGLIYLTDLFGYMGLLLILVPVTLYYAWGLHHFENLDGIGRDQLKLKPKIAA